MAQDVENPFTLKAQNILLAWKYASRNGIYISLIWMVLTAVEFSKDNSSIVLYYLAAIIVASLVISVLANHYQKSIKIGEEVTLSATLYLSLHLIVSFVITLSIFSQSDSYPGIFYLSSILLIVLFTTIANYPFVIAGIVFYTPIIIGFIILLLTEQPEAYQETCYLISAGWVIITFALLKYNRQYKIMVSLIHENISLTHNMINISDDFDFEKIRNKEHINKYQSLVEESPVSVLVINAKGIIVYVNPSAAEKFQYTNAEFVGMNVDVLVPKRYAMHGHLMEQFWKNAETKTMANTRDVYCLRKDGTEFLADIRLIPIEVNDDRNVYVYINDMSSQRYVDAVLAEMKEKEITQELLSKKNTRIQMYLDNINVIVVVFNKYACIEAYNRKIYEYIDRNGVMSDSVICEFLRIANYEDYSDYIVSVLQNKEFVEDFYVKKYIDTNGEFRCVEWSVSVARDEDENPIVLISGLDVTERLRIESIISNVATTMSRNSNESLLDSIVNSLSITLKADQALIATISSTKDEILETVSYAKSGELHKGITIPVKGALWESLRKSNVQSIFDRSKADKSYQEFMSSFASNSFISVPLLDGGGIFLGVLSLFFKNTKSNMDFELSICQVYSLLAAAELERINLSKEKETINKQLLQSQKMESIGQLTGGIAHDFNNMLASIIGFAELGMMRVQDDEKVKLYLKNIYDTGGQARDLIMQMLTFSRQVPGKMKELSVEAVIQEPVMMIKSVLPSSIDLIINIGEDMPVVMGDKVLLGQAILNLIINAKDAIGEKGCIEISSYYTKSVSGACTSCLKPIVTPMIVISVKDSGNGIEYENLEKIFEPFVTNKDIGKGTGMGLALVHGIMHEHGGHVQASTSKGQGSEFKLLLPASTTIQQVELMPNVEDVQKNITGSGRRILLVDDEPMVANLLNEILTLNNYEVDMYTDSQQALSAFSDNPNQYDLVLTDYTMPIITGAELAKKILEIRAGIPIILCTGYSEYIDEDSAKLMGISAYLNKPLIQSELIRTVYELTNP